jgi:hypothetical protein
MDRMVRSLLLGLWIADSPWALLVDVVLRDAALHGIVALGILIVALSALELRIKHRAPPRIMT